MKRLSFSFNVLYKFCSAVLTVLKSDVPNLSRLCYGFHRKGLRIWQQEVLSPSSLGYMLLGQEEGGEEFPP